MSKKLTRAQLEKIEQIKINFQNWVADRLEEGRPISYRMASRLIEAYAHTLQFSQEKAQRDLLAWGLDRLLIPDPTSSDFPRPGTLMHRHMLALWERRDLRQI